MEENGDVVEGMEGGITGKDDKEVDGCGREEGWYPHPMQTGLSLSSEMVDILREEKGVDWR